MTAATLQSRTAKDLAQLARQNGITGWHSMRKDELVTQLVRIASKRTLSTSGENGTAATNGNTRKTNPRVQRKIDQLKRKLANAKNIALAQPEQPAAPPKRTGWSSWCETRIGCTPSGNFPSAASTAHKRRWARIGTRHTPSCGFSAWKTQACRA